MTSNLEFPNIYTTNQIKEQEFSKPADSYLVPFCNNKGLSGKKEKTMNELKMKAKAGVTLVELLVVILIVTILSVSMLPLLQPFVTEAQYAAEAIPVIGNLRTKVGLYVYDKGKLPYDDSIYQTSDKVQTWTVMSGATSDDEYNPAVYDFTSQAVPRSAPVTLTEVNVATDKGGHINNMLDVDYQDLKGKRSKPTHYQFRMIEPNSLSYVVACFGDGNGLKAGTGYAVCELNFPTVNRKLIGTWKRYKAYNEAGGAIAFTDSDQPDSTTGKVLDCYVPKTTDIASVSSSTDVDNIVTAMVGAGWEF